MFLRDPARHPKLSIVIPLYNEEENIPLLVESIFKSFVIPHGQLELVLVNDGSHDRTAEIAGSYAASDPRIRLINHEHNRGLGGAIRTGLAAAEGDWILYTDADLPFDFTLIPQLLAATDSGRIVIGCRQNRGEGVRRWVLSKCYNILCRVLLGIDVSDVNFACKLIPKHVVPRMRLRSEGSFIDAELLLECRRNGLEFTEFPLTYYPRTRGISTLSRPAVIFGIFKELFRYLFEQMRNGLLKSQLAIDSPAIRYGIGFLTITLALLVAVLFNPLIGAYSFLVFLPAIVFTALYGGARSCMMTIILSVIASRYFLAPPIFVLSNKEDLQRLGVLVIPAILGYALRAIGLMRVKDDACERSE